MKYALKAGSEQWIRLSDLKAHPNAQRQLRLEHGDAIAKAFDPAKLGTITVARTKRGQLWVVDGQHRVYAALKFLDGDGEQCMRCMVIDVDTDADAATLFLGLNNHKTVLTLDKFMVRVVAKDPIAVGIVAVLTEHGLRVARTRGTGTVQAVDACEKIFSRQRGAALFDRVIRISSGAWGTDPDAYHAQILRGLDILLSKYGTQVDDTDLIRKLAKNGGPLGIIGQARDLRSVMGISMAQAMCERLKNEYNKGKRVDRLDEKAA